MIWLFRRRGVETGSEGERALDRTVAKMNVAHFKHLLETETDAEKRQTIIRLLAEEEAKVLEIRERQAREGAA